MPEEDAKRAAAVHLYFNLIGTIIFMCAFYGLNAILHFDFMDNTINAAGIASVPFNIQCGNNHPCSCHSAISLKSLPALQSRIRKRIKFLPEDKDLQMLDDRFLDSPGYAIMLCQNAVAGNGKAF